MLPRTTSLVWELGAGVALTVLSSYLLQASWTRNSASNMAGFEPTRRASAPPASLGPRYDDDQALAARSQALASYTWTARLDTEQHRVTGKGTIHWTNPSRTPATELFVHLYLNAFQNDQTLFLRSPFGAGRSGDKATRYGGISVKYLRARELGGRDLWLDAKPHSPSDPQDATDIEVPLPEPVAAGARLTLDVEFEAQLPEIVERTGYAGSYHFVAQWFPKLAKREPDGTWVHFPFHPQSEFYADFGDYHVTLDVPAEYTVGATGKRTLEKRVSGRKLLSFEQQDVTDFAWVAWDGFSERTQRVQGVEVRLLYPRDYESAADTTLSAITKGLPHFNQNYGRYPYSTLTVVHPPEYAVNSGGMEYPTLITTGSRWYTPYLGVRDLELVTIHELAHQWFYGLVATDEHSWPFMDEGLASYAESWALRQLYQEGSLMDSSLGQLSIDSFARAIAAERGFDDIVAKPAREFTSFGNLGALVYQRTATTLDTLGRVYGRDKLQQALGRYARHYRYRHPAPPHLLAALRESLGDQATDNFERAIFQRGWVDYVVRGVESVPAAGHEAPSAQVSQATGWHNRAVVNRHGDLKFPVDVELEFADGSRQVRRWSGEGTSFTMRQSGASELIRVRVDPLVHVRLDANLLNNSKSRERASLAKLREPSLFLTQCLLWVLGP